MNKFINREKELESLRKLYTSEGASLAIIYGRRRLGKTSLIKEFAKDLPHCYFLADRAGEILQINSMATAISTSLGESIIGTLSYKSWYELFETFDRFRNSDKKFVFIIDEFQYLCLIQSAFSSFIQKWWDEHWQNQNIMIILCGSVTSMMYKETLSYSSPLYGRSSLQILLSPIRYKYLSMFIPNVDNFTLIEFYSLCGGVPKYIELIKRYKNFKTALKELVLLKNGELFNEAKYLLQEEITTPNVCWGILNAIASGSTRISELGAKLNLPANQLTRYLDLLKDLFLIRREIPILETMPHKSKKGIYTITDPFMRLWFGCVYPFLSFLEFEEPEKIIERVLSLSQQHISVCFEELSREYLRMHMLDYDCIKVGRQWDRNYEIDVVGLNESNELSVVGECKWSNSKVGISIYEELVAKVTDNKFNLTKECKFIFFSKSGFTEELCKLAKTKENIVLVNDIFDAS